MDIDHRSDWDRSLPQYTALLALTLNNDIKSKRVSIRSKHIPAIQEALYYFLEINKKDTEQ